MMAKLCALGMLVCFVGVLLSEYGWRGKKVFGVLCAVILMIGLADGISEIFSGVSSLSEDAGVSDVCSVAMKVVGTGYVFGFCADVARELGESSVSSILTLAGRVEILLLVLPYFQRILEFGMELVK